MSDVPRPIQQAELEAMLERCREAHMYPVPLPIQLTERMVARLKWCEAEIERLRAQVAGHCERIAKQSELLSRKAELPAQPANTEWPEHRKRLAELIAWYAEDHPAMSAALERIDSLEQLVSFCGPFIAKSWVEMDSDMRELYREITEWEPD